MTEIEPCPKCGALPCDWTDNPHTAPSGDEVQRVARAIHGAKMEGHNPDCLYEHHEWENWPVDDRREYADPFTGKTRVQLFHKAWRRYESAAQAAIAAMRPASGVFAIGDRVTKIKGSAWTGRVVGTYSTTLTPEGYAVESENELGSVQIYPAAALRLASGDQYQHVKRGTVYTVIGEAELQASSDNLVDGSALVLYQGGDGKVWAREEGEFHDGRFAALRQAGEG